MHNKLLKKFYILKILTLCLPSNKIIRKNNFYLCKYIAAKTPYIDIDKFFKEIYKILLLKKNSTFQKNLIFFCSNKIFYNNLKKIKKNCEITNKKVSFFILCNQKYTTKQISYIKDRKIPTIGFINLTNIAQITDYIILLENKYFASFFLFKYVLKKLLIYVPY